MHPSAAEIPTQVPICKVRLGEALLAKRLITPDQLHEAIRIQASASEHKKLGQILVDLHHVSEEDLTKTLAEMLGVSFRHLESEMVSLQAVSRLPADFLEQHNVLPLTLEGDRMEVAIGMFSDIELLEVIARKSGCTLRVVAALPENIRHVRRVVLREDRLATSGPEESKDRAIESILDQIGTDDVRVVESPLESEADLEASARESPVVALVNNIIKSAVRLSASDIHIEPAEGTLRVRCRVDGELVVTARPTLRLLPAVVSRIKILGGMDISQRRMPQDGGVTVTLFGRSVDLRISTMATKFGEKVVIRIVDREGGLRKLHEIGMAPPMLERFRGALQEPNGILLVTGPTGSGKSTTMYAALVEILNDRRNVSTIEDPVERIVPGLNQFQVNPKAGFTFATAMRSMLRQDPDVIMVGEIRDSETAKLAAEAALTGHLVLSTLHTNDAPSAVPRLVNMGVESYLVAAAVRGVLAQRLVRRLCPNCVKPVAPTAAQRGVLRRLQPEGPPLEQAFEASGCGQCGSSGVRGRVGVYDFLAVSESMTPLFDVLSNPQSLKRLSLEGGSQGLLPDGLERVRRGEIGIDSLLELVSRSTSNEPAIAA